MTSRPSSALDRPEFPWRRVSALLGLEAEDAQVALRDDERSREAVEQACRDFIAADDERRAGRIPSSPIALHPDFPTGTGMSLIGACVLWQAHRYLPALGLRAAIDHYEDGDDEIAASFVGLVRQHAEAGENSAEAWAAESLLLAIMQRSGDPAEAEILARELVAYHVPLDLWRETSPGSHLPDDAMDWHGGAMVEGMPPRRDGSALSVEDAEAYLHQLMTQMQHEAEAEGDGGRSVTDGR